MVREWAAHRRALVTASLVPACVLVGLLVLAVPGRSPGAPFGPVTWHLVKANWAVIAVGPHQGSLEVIDLTGGCGTRNSRASVLETSRTVHLEVHHEEGSGLGPLPCPFGVRALISVTLKHPLGGRRIAGRQSPDPLDEQRSGSVRVPLLVGFAPADAKRALALVALRSIGRLARAAPGLRRVTGQLPGAGTVVAHSTVVQLRVIGR